MRRQIILLIPWCDYLHLADEDAVRWRCLRTIKERTLSFSSSFLLQENYAVRLIRDYLVTHTITDTLEIILIQGSARTHTCTSSLFLKMVFVVKIHRFILNNKIFLYLWLISMWFFLSSWARISDCRKIFKVWWNALQKSRMANYFSVTSKRRDQWRKWWKLMNMF